MNDWKCVYSTDNLHDASLLKAFLESEDIESVIHNQRDSLYPIGSILLMVQAEDENLATELIEQYLQEHE